MKHVYMCTFLYYEIVYSILTSELKFAYRNKVCQQTLIGKENLFRFIHVGFLIPINSLL